MIEMKTVIKKKGRGESRNKSNLEKLEAYLKLHDVKPNIQDNRGLRNKPQ